jgi:integrase
MGYVAGKSATVWPTKRGKVDVALDDDGSELIERHMLSELREMGEYTRVVLVNGPRQAGKTTLLEQLRAELGGRSDLWTSTRFGGSVPDLHFHDLRHSGNHLAALAGATKRELMNRMGYDSMRAALIYQRGSEAAARAIADAMDALADSDDDGDEEDSE